MNIYYYLHYIILLIFTLIFGNIIIEHSNITSCIFECLIVGYTILTIVSSNIVLTIISSILLLTEVGNTQQIHILCKHIVNIYMVYVNV